ncbi:MAG: Holliday junction branch migration DNA helicase RuvB [Mycoplasma sp.]|nr:Holliday junction branch migration DNA helicase RuvB [Mycoplasma sp.]
MNSKNKLISLRPSNFDSFIGQEKIIKTIKVVIESSKKQNKTLDHIIFYGPPGRGKTTLATIIANYSNRKIIYVQGGLIEKKSDILSIFTGIEKNDIIFIDEIHSINNNLEELIYSALEDNVIDIQVGPEGEKRILRMKIKPFTLIGSTTNFSKISQPIRDRFGLVFKLNSYSNEELAKIIMQSANTLKHKIDNDLALMVASFSQETPRIANRLIKRIIDFADYYNNGLITNEIIFKTPKSLSIYKEGLTETHIDYLKILFETFDQKHVSLDVIISLLNENKNMIKNEIEPLLLSKKLITKSSRGRSITTLGVEYMLKHDLKIV